MYSIRSTIIQRSINAYGKTSLRLLSTASPTATTTKQDFQFIERSTEPTDKYQSQLPILPIPELNETCKRYLDAVRPLIIDGNQMSNTEKYVNDFKNKIGHQLDHELRKRNENNRESHYFHDYWNEGYLAYRVPIVVNVNPYMILENDPKIIKNPTLRATSVLISLLRYRRSLIDNVLTPEKLEMRPFKNLFSTTRLPRSIEDKIEYFGTDHKHVIFLHNGQFYKFNVLDQNGDIKTPQDIYNFISNLKQYKEQQTEHSITTFSALDRDQWTLIRSKLENLTERNRKNLNTIDSALFIVNLDEEQFNDDDLNARSLGYLHGTYRPENLSEMNSQNDLKLNRWFDKSIQLIISSNGDAGINFEHSPFDGIVVLNLLNRIYRDTNDLYDNYLTNLTNNKSTYNISAFKLNFDLDDGLKNDLSISIDHYRRLIENVKMSVVSYEEMNRDYLKTKNISPDFVFQMAFQMANYKLFNKTSPTYEACSTVRFKMGRTENIRAATMETKLAAKCLAWGEKKFTFSDLRESLNAASTKHQELSRLAANGHGCDRHLFAMKCLAKSLDMSTPSIFTDPTYNFANHFILSTSHLYADRVCSGGYGPVVDNGFGLAYGFTDRGLTLNCTSFESQDADQFSDAFIDSLKEINNVLERSTKLKPEI